MNDINEKTISVDDFFDISIDMLCISDNSGKIIRVSNSWEKTLGYTRDELEEHQFLEFVHPDDIVSTIKKMGELKQNIDVKYFVNRYRCKNGEYKSIEWNTRMIGNEGFSVARDVTVKIDLENKAKELNWFLEQAQIVANLGFYNFNIIENKWASTVTLDELFGIDTDYQRNLEGWLAIVDPDYQKIMIDYFTKDVLEKHMPFDKEYMIRKVNSGERRWVHGKGTVFYSNDSNPINMIGTIQDIHERKLFDDYRSNLESSLYEEKERLRITFESIGDGIITTDIEGEVKFLNKSAEHFTGWLNSEASGRAFEEVFVINNETTGEKSKNPINCVLSTNNICELENHTMLTSKNGEIYHIADSAAPIKNQNNETVGVVMVFRDVTEKKASEQIIKQSAEIIEKMQTGIYIYLLEDFNDDKTLRLISANEASTKIIGVKREEIVGKYIDEIFPSLRNNEIPAKFAEVVRTGNPIEIEDFDYNDQNILESVFSFKALKIQKDQVCVLFDNITEKRKYLEEVKFVSFHDILTGLYNRAFITKKLPEIDQEPNLPIAVLLGDINGLKLINDVYGHEIGDELLKKISSILVKACPDKSFVSRWGGDEFKIISPNTSMEQANAIIYNIKAECQNTKFESIIPSISLGVSIKTNMNENLNDTFREAENRMYTHKLVEGKSIRNSIIASLQKALFEKSCETEEHAMRMMDLASKMASHLSMSQHEMDEMNLLTMLHDIGKMGISNSILNKAGALSVKEWFEVKKHPEIGYRIAQAITELARISDLILSHHEHWDGSGYPQGLKGDSIPKVVRVLSIIDAYDVMTNGRPYKNPVSNEEALIEIEKYAGTQFDPSLAKEFVSMMRN